MTHDNHNKQTVFSYICHEVYSKTHKKCYYFHQKPHENELCFPHLPWAIASPTRLLCGGELNTIAQTYEGLSRNRLIEQILERYVDAEAAAPVEAVAE